MNEYDIKRLALVLALQSEIEGMKAANEYCKIENHKPAYIGYDFSKKAEELRTLAYKHNDQL